MTPAERALRYATEAKSGEETRQLVVYGLQVSKVLDYRLAAIEFGQCVMHSLGAGGKLDE